MSNAPTTAKRITTALVAEIDSDELACRILEAITGTRKPRGLTATEALAEQSPEFQAMARTTALCAMEYMVECINKGKRPS